MALAPPGERSTKKATLSGSPGFSRLSKSANDGSAAARAKAVQAHRPISTIARRVEIAECGMGFCLGVFAFIRSLG